MNKLSWMNSALEWAAEYFGEGNFYLFDEMANKVERLSDWEYVNRTPLSVLADRLGFHGGSIHSRNDISTEPTPL